MGPLFLLDLSSLKLELKSWIEHILTSPRVVPDLVINKFPEPVKARVIRWAREGREELVKQVGQLPRVVQHSEPWEHRRKLAGGPIGPGSYRRKGEPNVDPPTTKAQRRHDNMSRLAT